MKKLKLELNLTLTPKRTEYFAFALNECNYKRVSFTRHFSRDAADKSAYRPFRHEIDSYTKDLSSEVIAGRDAFITWTKECDYTIDWKNKILIHKDAKK